MIAGSSTGSILTAALVAPLPEDRTKPAYYAEKVLHLFENSGADIYKNTSINKGLLAVMTVFGIIIGGVSFFKWGKGIFANPQVDESFKLLREYVKECKHDAKLYEKPEENKDDLKRFASSFRKSTNLDFHMIKHGDEIKEKLDSH